MKEEWKEHNGMLVSSYGKVFIPGDLGWNEMKKDRLVESEGSYATVRKNGAWSLHNLVATVFVPNPDNKEIVHHINEDPSNNRADNLMWVTRAEHCKMHMKDRKKSKHMREKLSKTVMSAGNHKAKTVLQYTLEGEFIKEWGSGSEASRHVGVAPQQILRACHGDSRRTSAGYKWRFKEKEDE